jgi:hypothetical protein
MIAEHNKIMPVVETAGLSAKKIDFVASYLKIFHA